MYILHVSASVWGMQWNAEGEKCVKGGNLCCHKGGNWNAKSAEVYYKCTCFAADENEDENCSRW